MSIPSASSVANWFLDKAASENRGLDQLQLQKLLYYANGWYLANKGVELFSDNIYAWPHGPVVPSIWKQFRDAGRGKIKNRAFELQIPDHGSFMDGKYLEAKLPENSGERVNLLEKVWDAYGKDKFTGIQLSNMTHAPDEPWSLVRNTESLHQRPIIPTEVIRQSFKRKMVAAG